MIWPAQVVAHDKVERGGLGVSVQGLTPELAKSFSVETPKGELITDVVKGGPADKADNKRRDVVIAFQGKIISDATTLRNEVVTSPIGQKMEVTVLRGGKHEFTVEISSLHDAIKMQAASIKAHLGVAVRLVTSQEVEGYGQNSQHGVVITQLDPDGPMGEVGFEVGDMILEINGQTIEHVEGLVELVSSFRPHQRITLLALDHRSGRTGYVQVDEE